MSIYKKLCKLAIFLTFLIVFYPLASIEGQEKQEVTEEFFYAEEDVEIASLKPQPVEEAPGIVSVINAQQIKDMLGAGVIKKSDNNTYDEDITVIIGSDYTSQ